MAVEIRCWAAGLLCLLLSACGGTEHSTSSTSDPQTAQHEFGEAVAPLLVHARDLASEGQHDKLIALCDRILAQRPEEFEALLLRGGALVALGRSQDASRDADIAERLKADDPAVMALRARIAVVEKRFADADAAFTRALARDPRNAALLGERALVRAVLEQHDAAISDFTEAIRISPRESAFYRWRAEEYFSAGRFADALDDAENAIRLVPDNPDYHVARAHFLAQLGMINEAIESYRTAIDLDDAAFTYYLRGNLLAALQDFDAALADLTTAIEKEPGRAEYLLARGNVALQRGDAGQAREDYDRALEIDPAHVPTRLQRAALSLMEDHFDASIEDLTVALQHSPGLHTALRLRGIAYRNDQDFEQAIADFQEAINTANQEDLDQSAELMYQQALTWQAQDAHERAVESLIEALRLNPKLAQAHYALWLSYGALQQFDKAIESLNAAIRTDPRNTEYLLARADFHLAESQVQQELREGDPAETLKAAMADAEQAARLDPEDDSAWYALGVVCVAAGNLQKAVDHLTRAIELDPHDPRYYQARGDIRLKRQQYVSAIDDFTKAIELKPDDPELYESRGLGYSELGKNHEAQSDYQKAASLAAAAGHDGDESRQQ